MCAECLRKRKLPQQLRRNSSSVFDPAHDSIKVMTLHVSKGLEFPVVALGGAGRMPAEGEDEREEARLFYVGATRATQRLVMGPVAAGSSLRACRKKARPEPAAPQPVFNTLRRARIFCHSTALGIVMAMACMHRSSQP
jgi:ATP-dependent exoDNAse (exonuclease V) beta subunit